MKYRFLSAIVIALAVATLVACGQSSPTTPSDNGTTTVTTPGTPGTPGGGTGRLSISLKDSPFSDATAVLVTFSEVSAHHSGGGWFTVPFADAATQRVCDLKKLETAEDILGVATLEAGHYTQIRLTVTSAVLYFGQTSPTGACFVTTPPVMVGSPVDPQKPTADVNIPSGELKLNRPFDLPADGLVKVLLDFDGDKSIHMTGNGKYQMSPVISVVSVQ